MRAFLAIVVSTSFLSCVPITTTGSGPGTPSAAVIRTGDQLLAAMHRRYADSWYRTLTFVQKSTYYRPDGSILRTETWYEAAKLPGRLRIDIGEPSGGNGALYRSDSIYMMRGGRVAQGRREINPMLTLGFDVYRQSPQETAEQLRRMAFTGSLRVDTLDGRRVYVVGATRGDSVTNQFWVDAERLLFVRAIQTISGQTRDMRFERYTQYDGGWVAETVRILNGGRLAFLEEYSRVQVNDDLPDDLFLPERWNAATHWYRP